VAANSKTFLALAASALILGACGQKAGFAAGQDQAASEAPDLGYRKPPELRGAAKAADGTVSLNGVARPSSRVRLLSLSGVRVDTTAEGSSGDWRMLLGPVTEPALYDLVGDPDGQKVQAEGLVTVLPGAPTVALLRAGAGAQVQGAAQGVLKILAVDYDGGGGVVVSGRAKAGAPVRVMADGQLPAEGVAGVADPDGRFSLTLPKPLQPGPHHLQATTPQASAAVDVTLTPAQTPQDGRYQVQAEPFGWRIDWTTAASGLQTTLLLGG